MTQLTQVKLEDDNSEVYSTLLALGMKPYDTWFNDRGLALMEKEYWDGYSVCGDLIDEFVSAFPPLKDAWAAMSGREKWLFVEAMHYGIHSFVYAKMGFKQGV